VKARGEKQARNGPPSEHRDALATELTEAESDLVRIEAQHNAAKARIAALRSELAAREPTSRPLTPVPLSGLAPRTPADKVSLFRQLFRGRPDVYPTRFVSKKTGKPGYAPACSNKFVSGVCELPKVKCSDCTRQAFKPVDDAAVFAHLKGRHVMGVYPMQDDETCWFLAVDFDRSAWMNDVRAFVQTSRRLGLPVAIERSRSGNGAHVWSFFAAPVPAATARKMGCHLITETMADRHELGMDSYDRLFPGQDTMPRGGFGNLIALPLQHGPRQEGNSVFLDEDLPDQAYCGLPESGVLQEAEPAAVDSAHPAGDLLRRRSPAACRASPRLYDRSRGTASRSRRRSRCRRRARLRRAACAALPRNALAGSR